MSLLKKMVGIFIEDEGSAAKPDPKVASGVPTLTPPVFPQLVTQAPGAVLVDGKKMEILRALAEYNQPGYDFFEFQTGVNSMSAKYLNEADLYKASYEFVSTTITPEQLVQSGNYYLQCLQHIRTGLETQTQQRSEGELIPAQEQLVQTEAAIVQTEEQIKMLQASLEQLRANKQQLTITINQVSLDLNNQSSATNTAFEAVNTAISAMITKIEKYLLTK